MESRFDYDFCDVRLHTDSKSNKAVESVHADAFATGKDVYFKDSNISSNSVKHSVLRAHELAHVVQQVSKNSIECCLKIINIQGHSRNKMKKEFRILIIR